MSELPCCSGSSWQSEIDLDRADGFELDLGTCTRCGTPWMSVWCAGSGALSKYIRVTEAIPHTVSTRDVDRIPACGNP